MTPSDFTNMPQNSVLQSYKAERMARNIMFILRRTGNKWRIVDWSEYEAIYKNDPDFKDGDQKLFESVIPYCQGPTTARTFSHAWEGKIS